MATVPIRIPQLGEGLQEARLVRFLKQSGETVKRDEPLYEMETDKAVTEVESPQAGVLQEWLAEEGSVHPIGAEIGAMQVDAPEHVKEVETSPETDASTDAGPAAAAAATPDSEAPNTTRSTAASVPKESGVRIPPRTRRYLREKNLEAMACEIPAAGNRLTEADVDRFLHAGKGTHRQASLASETSKHERPTGTLSDYTESVLTTTQQTLNYRMARGAQVVIPATLETDLDWSQIQACRDKTREQGGPTGFAMALWCVAQAMSKHPSLRSSLAADGKLMRTYTHVNLGVAVALPGDELNTAVVSQAETLSQQEFFLSLAERIEAARAGTDQVDAATTVSVSNIGALDMRAGIPVVVAPAVATIAIGKVRPHVVPRDGGLAVCPVATLTMSFDHRLINGVGAASFLNELRERVANFALQN